MKKQALLSLCVVSFIAASACNDEVQIKNRTFKELCEISGGEIEKVVQKEGESDEQTEENCKCGKETCSSGVVCIYNGAMCAERSISIGGLCSENEKNSDKEYCLDGTKNVLGERIICAGTNGQYKWKYLIKENTQDNEDNKEYCKNSCNSNHICGACKNGEKQCDSGAIVECKNGEWSLFMQCPYGVCADETSCGECVTGATKCQNGNEYTCEKGNWGEPKGCNGNSCNAAGDSCGVCLDNTTKCSNSKSSVCVYGEWLESACENGGVCKDATSCGDCKSGESKCEDNARSSCINGNWAVMEVCKTGCSADGKCIEPVCTDGMKKCENGKEYTCKDNSWGEGTTCADGASCKDEYSCGNCQSGESKCEDDARSACINGNWAVMEVCKAGCSEDGKCIEPICTEGATKCVVVDGESTEYICSNHSWNDAKKCGSNVSCQSATRCGECLNGMTKCENNAVSTCVDGQWSAFSPCSASCNGNSCGECKNGETRCNNGMLKTCVDGTWGEETECSDTDKVSCISETQCGECANGSVDCISFSGLSTCQNGVWITEQCEDPKPYCDPVLKSCTKNECNDNDTRCINDEIELYGTKNVCKEKKWRDASICKKEGDNVSCNSFNDDCGVCLNGRTRCENGYITTCVKGAFDESSRVKCPNEYDCLDSEICMECKDGSVMYEKDSTSPRCIKRTCMRGRWEDSIMDYSCHMTDDGSYVLGSCLDSSPAYTQDETTKECSEHYCYNGSPVNNDSKNSCVKDDSGVYIKFGECNNAKVEYRSESDVCVKIDCINGSPEIDSSFNPDKYSCNSAKTGLGECPNGLYTKTGISSWTDNEILKCNVSGGEIKSDLCVEGNWHVAPHMWECTCVEVGKYYRVTKCKGQE